jgi:hypothetical protein
LIVLALILLHLRKADEAKEQQEHQGSQVARLLRREDDRSRMDGGSHALALLLTIADRYGVPPTQPPQESA